MCVYVCVLDNFTDAAVSGRVNGEHKEKDLEPWDGGETHASGSLESLDTDVVRDTRAHTHTHTHTHTRCLSNAPLLYVANVVHCSVLHLKSPHVFLL